MLGVESCQLPLFDEDGVNLLLKWPIKRERERAGAGRPLRKGSYEVGGTDALGPVDKGALPPAKNTSFCWIFLPPFFIVATSYRQEKRENIVLPPWTNGVNHQLLAAARAAA